jgi:molybdate transport system regulatory protein
VNYDYNDITRGSDYSTSVVSMSSRSSLAFPDHEAANQRGWFQMVLRVRSKIWIENDQGKLVIGTGRLRILEAILEAGSINKAARKLRQPFRAVWGKIRATEERCGFKIVETTSEGSRLTREGLELLWTYTRLRTRCEKFADAQFVELFDSDGKQGKSRTRTGNIEPPER